jgi:transcriptional regulator with XRE-family HTH domain
MKSTRLLRANLRALLRARGQTPHDLAFFCRRSDAWISKILNEDEHDSQARDLPLKYLDRIADFFGVAAYQLFQPGISAITERRKANDRRTGIERRARSRTPGAILAADLELTPEDVSDLLQLRALGKTKRAELRKMIDERLRGRRFRPKRGIADVARESSPETRVATD